MQDLSTEPGLGEREAADRDAIVDRLLDLVRVLARETKVRLPDDLASLTAHQLDALALLADDDRSMGDLCGRLGIAQSAGTALVTKLVARGLVARHEDPADRRVVGLHLTAEAAGIVGRFQALRREQARTLVAPLSDAQLAALLRIYETIVGAVPQRRAGIGLAAPATGTGVRSRPETDLAAATGNDPAGAGETTGSAPAPRRSTEGAR